MTDGQLHEAATRLARPGLVVVTGGPGSGRTTALHRLADLLPGPVHLGGGLAAARTVPALALARAVRARLPGHDIHLLTEAVRSRVRGGLLLLDDLHLADAATLAAVPAIARYCRVAVTVRTPHQLPAAAAAALRAAATAWLTLPPLTADEATALARHVAPTLPAAVVTAVVARAGGTPLVVATLARHAAAGRPVPDPDPTADPVAYAVGAALADLTRPARTALAALGLLGRPATATLLGPGAADLVAAGLVTADDDRLAPVSGYVAEVAAGILDPDSRRALHRRLADLVPAAEAPRHLAAAGDPAAAHRAAVTAAAGAAAGVRADLLLFACDLPAAPVTAALRVAAADAALAAGRPRVAVRVLTAPAPLGLAADLRRGEALLHLADPAAAAAAVRRIPDAAPPELLAARDRVLLLAELATDPRTAAETADKITARHGARPHHLGLRAAVAAVRAAHRTPGWADELAAAAAAAGTGGDPHTARWAAWLLVEHLAADGRLDDAAAAAHRSAAACAADLAYGWQTRFLAAALWCTALHGAHPGGTGPPGAPPPGGADSGGPAGSVSPGPTTGPDPGDPGPAVLDDVLRRATDLADHALPDAARGYATAAAALVEADSGQLATARTRLASATGHPAAAWVAREAAWLDGQPDQAATAPPADAPALLAGLHRITARWAAHDGAPTTTAPITPPGAPAAVRQTLTAWATGAGFPAAAQAWTGVAIREQTRCLLAAGLHEPNPPQAVAHLLAAEQLATGAGLVVLAGRARRALRRYAAHRDPRTPHTGAGLTRREQDVLRLVAQGEPTRRIAGQLGISVQTVETHIRASLRKLGARTRTEAAALALQDTW